MSTEAAILEHQPVIYQDYSRDYKAEVLALVVANGGNVQQTARETGIPHQTIRSWLESNRYSDFQSQKQLDLAQKHENNLHRLADSVTNTDLETVSFMQKVTAI